MLAQFVLWCSIVYLMGTGISSKRMRDESIVPVICAGLVAWTSGMIFM